MNAFSCLLAAKAQLEFGMHAVNIIFSEYVATLDVILDQKYLD